MRRISLALLAALASAAAGCATERAAEAAAPVPSGSLVRAAELARVRCLLVAPLENGSDAPLAAEQATNALLSAVDPSRAKVFPVTELRGLFRDTPVELPQGISPSLALELAELLGADAALWGSVEGRTVEAAPDVLVTLRLSLAGNHQLVFAETVPVRPAPGEKAEAAIRRAVLASARPMLARLGAPGTKRCFDAERTRALRRFALAEPADGRGHATAAAPAAAPPAPAPAKPAPVTVPVAAVAAPAKVEPKNPRQAEWAKRLGEGGRLLVEDVAFAGRSADLRTEAGLQDLAGALLAQPALAVRIEGFVDTTSDRAGDQKLSSGMALAVMRRLGDLGVPRQRLTAAGRGGESPILPNFTARGRAANRRIEVVGASER